jgi:hypothetical protein
MSARRAFSGALWIATALVACAPTPPETPVVTVSPAPTVTASATAPRPPPEPRPWAPKAPFTVVARAGPDDDFAVFPLEKGHAIVAVARASDPRGTLRLARIEGDTIVPAPELLSGLPPEVFRDKALPLVAGRYPDALWLTRGDTSCVGYQWDPAKKTWAERPTTARVPGKCTRLSAWTPGAAIAAFEGKSGPTLVAFGKPPRVIPALPARAADQPRSCGGRLAAIQQLSGFPSGEVLALAPACGVQKAWLVRWARGSAKGDAVDAEVDPNAPYLGRVISKDEVAIQGAGVLAQGGEETSVQVKFVVSRGKLRRASIEPHAINALERWLYEARKLVGAADEGAPEGFRYEGFSLTDGDDVLVFGKRVQRGEPVASLLLRSRPVKAPAEMR